MKNTAKDIQRDKEGKQRGSSLVEYSLLVALISVVCVGAVRTVGLDVRGAFRQVSASGAFSP